MKNTIIYAFAGFFFLHISCSKPVSHLSKSTNKNAVKENCVLDSLIQSVESDEYGMQKYIIAYLKRGPNRDRSEVESQALQKAHMENIGRMAEEGKLVLAGPFLDDGEVRGIYIFNVPTVEEAEALTATDPAIQAGSLVMELVPWYGSAAVQTINYMHNKIQSKSILED